jgi:hypothetical protein
MLSRGFCVDDRTPSYSRRKLAPDRLGLPRRLGQIEDPQLTAEVLLGTIKTLVLRGETRRLMLSNRAIDAFREFKQAA